MNRAILKECLMISKRENRFLSAVSYLMIAISKKNSKEKISSYLLKHAKNAADEDIEWITVKGNHIPIKPGQTKEEAVKDWLEQKHDKNTEIKTPAEPPTDGVIKDTVKKLYKRYKESNCESIEPAYQYPEKIAGVKRGRISFGFEES